MFRKPGLVTLACLGFALLAGFLWTGHWFYRMFIGLDESAFPAGAAIQRIAVSINPELKNAVGGGIWVALSLLLIAAIAFFVARASKRAAVAEVDPGRRTFLTGAGWGTGAAVGSPPDDEVEVTVGRLHDRTRRDVVARCGRLSCRDGDADTRDGLGPAEILQP